MNSIELCAGAGGQALGPEQAGFRHSALVEIEPDFAVALRLNRPQLDGEEAEAVAEPQGFCHGLNGPCLRYWERTTEERLIETDIGRIERSIPYRFALKGRACC